MPIIILMFLPLILTNKIKIIYLLCEWIITQSEYKEIVENSF